MKLVRIISKEDQDTGSFSNDFSDQITLPAYTQVALVNASMSLESMTIDVNSSNGLLKYKQKSTGTEQSVVLTPGKYGKQSFLAEVSRALNVVASQSESNPYGFQ